MNYRRIAIYVLAATVLGGCATTSSHQGTLAELRQVEPDLNEVYLEDSLQRAAQSYERYLQETEKGARTPEAMRRLADLQIEQEFGIIAGASGTEPVEMAVPDLAGPADRIGSTLPTDTSGLAAEETESERQFQERATQQEVLAATPTEIDPALPGMSDETVPAGPREAIKIYREILETYPNYERNDQVLYQMSRAYDEISQPDDAMEVMDRLVAEYPYSNFNDEVFFRRGEYYFVRRSYIDAEEAYGEIVKMGSHSSYYELALYKLGWALYKQELYEEALHHYMAMLDYRKSIGYDFDQADEEDEEHRVADTFRVISLSFSNLGGPEVVDEYFSARGQRSYADKIYRNLGEFFLAKLRYDDAASVYKSFINLNPFHKVAPYFGMRVVEIYGEAGFPQLVVESKKEFATTYALNAEYWRHFDVENSADVIGFLKTNLTDLANHYHAVYQDEAFIEQRPQSFAEADRWYRQFLSSFPADDESPQINYQLADLLLENEDFAGAATEYERTAYEYTDHDRAAAAGYAAVYAYREELKVATGARQFDVKQATVASSLRFADTFPAHEQAPVVLGAAADDLYEIKDFPLAIASAHKLIERYPTSDESLRRSAWAVVAHSSIDLAEYGDAELAYTNLLGLTPDDDESKVAVIDGLAASIYKQGEQANLLEDYRAAANHFLRIKDVAPTSDIRTNAEYDAAAAFMKLQDWTMASEVLEEFRVSNPEHELQSNATKQLAYIYRENGQVERSALEHERIAAESDDPELSREALLTAAELYDEVHVVADTIRVYEQYIADFPWPLDVAMESRSRLSEIYKDETDYTRYYAMLDEIVRADGEAGAERSDRSRFLAARAALVLTELQYEKFTKLTLGQPFEESLARKQQSMDETLAALTSLVDYEVADVTAAATYYIAEIYLNFSVALLESERPAGLSDAEKLDYDLVLEEEAFPFEEQAIEVHEANFELLADGVYNPWVQKSLNQLATLMPGRYAKNEISGGFLESIDFYAYRLPNAPDPGADEQEVIDSSVNNETENLAEATAQVLFGSNSGEQ